MRKENASVGLKVIFGRRRGEKTKGVIERCNSEKAKVRITEDRGSKSEVGEVWGVPYSMMEPDRKHAEDMIQAARDLNDAVMERDLDKAKAAILLQGPWSKGLDQQRALTLHYKQLYGVARLLLEATFHFDRTADDADWEWLLENL